MTEQTGDTHDVETVASGPARLGFNEIVPGLSAAEAHRPGQDTGPVIPEFNLDQQMMARHRRSVASRRRGPGQQKTPVNEAKPEAPVQTPTSAPASWSSVLAPQYNAIIADIVARDLARLCRGKWQSSEFD